MFCELTASGKRSSKNTERAATGFFEKIWAKGLEQYDELEGIGWEKAIIRLRLRKGHNMIDTVNHHRDRRHSCKSRFPF